MPDAATHSQLDQLLQHPALWRGRSAAVQETWATGFAALDQALPGGGWPRTGLIELLIPCHGLGELRLWMPLLTRLTQSATARWCAFVAPPFELFAPAFAAFGLRLDKLLIVRAPQPLWALEQTLVSGACDLSFCWMTHARPRDLRRLGLATEQGRTPAVIFRPLGAEREASPAALRIAIEADPQAIGLRLRFIKSRGGKRGVVDLTLDR
jgi:cell division inhibitor SulA/protein ImuA